MQSADEIGNHAFPLLALMVVGVVFEDMTPLAKNLAILLVEGISALLKRRLVVNFKASGFLATLAAPPSGIEKATAKAHHFIAGYSRMILAHYFGGATGRGGGRSCCRGALSNPSFSCLMP